MPRIRKEWFPIETAPENEDVILIKEGIHPELKVPYTPVVGKIVEGCFISTTYKHSGTPIEGWLTHWRPCPPNPCTTKLS